MEWLLLVFGVKFFTEYNSGVFTSTTQTANTEHNTCMLAPVQLQDGWASWLQNAQELFHVENSKMSLHLVRIRAGSVHGPVVELNVGPFTTVRQACWLVAHQVCLCVSTINNRTMNNAASLCLNHS